MTRIVSILLTAVFVLALGINVLAQSTPSVDNREHRQQKRIKHGVKSGSLTKREAAKLEAGQAKTQRMEAKAKADGTVTAKERAKLQKRENKTSKKIYRQKHDNQTRP
jgi:hypothetical protein